jgi:hypothetical protein
VAVGVNAPAQRGGGARAGPPAGQPGVAVVACVRDEVDEELVGAVEVGRELFVVDAVVVDEDLVRDMTEIFTWMCACLCGKDAAANRAKRAFAAAATAEVEAA